MLGSGTGFPTERRASPGLILKDNSVTLIDPGPGALCRAASHGVSAEDLDIVAITHFHLDHTLDLMALFFARIHLKKNGCLKPMKVIGPKDLSKFVEKMEKLYGAMINPDEIDVELVEINEGPFDFSTVLKGSAHLVQHHGDSLGYRIETDGKILGISGDSAPCEGLVDIGGNADLFLLECSFPDDGCVEGHLTPEAAGKIASRANPKKLVLYHIYPVVDPQVAVKTVKRFFDGDVKAAEDGEYYQV